LPPWNEVTCIECLEALAQHEDVLFEDGAPQKIMELMGIGIPHYVQKFFAAANECRTQQLKEIFIRDVETAYDERMLGVMGQADMSSYEERLRKVLNPKLFEIAILFLTETAVKGRLSLKTIETMKDCREFAEYSDPSSQRQVLDILVHDGYFKFEGKSYVFVFKLLKDWWRRRYISGYTPILKKMKNQ